MLTIRGFLVDKMNNQRRYYNLLRRELKRAERLLGPIMDVEISVKHIYGGSGTPFLSFHANDDEEGRQLVALLMDTLDVAEAEKKGILESAYTIIIENEEMRLDVDVDIRPCKTLKVTEQRIIKVCGEIDESRYLSVVPLEDE